MLSKQHAISISVCIIFSALIPVSPAFSQDTPAHFTLQLLHAADLESGVEALKNAPPPLLRRTERAQSRGGEHGYHRSGRHLYPRRVFRGGQ